MNDTDSINNLYQVVQEQSGEHPYNNSMKKWRSEEELSVDELTDKINDLKRKIKELEEKGPQQIDPSNPHLNPEYFRQTFLTFHHRHIQKLMALRSKKFKNR